MTRPIANTSKSNIKRERRIRIMQMHKVKLEHCIIMTKFAEYFWAECRGMHHENHLRRKDLKRNRHINTKIMSFPENVSIPRLRPEKDRENQTWPDRFSEGFSETRASTLMRSASHRSIVRFNLITAFCSVVAAQAVGQC